MSVFLAAKCQIVVGDVIIQRGIPIDAAQESVDFIGRAAGGIEAADQTTHAGSGEVVDGNVMLLKPAQDADMSEAQSAAAFQNEGDAGTTLHLRRGVRSD